MMMYLRRSVDTIMLESNSLCKLCLVVLMTLLNEREMYSTGECIIIELHEIIKYPFKLYCVTYHSNCVTIVNF